MPQLTKAKNKSKQQEMLIEEALLDNYDHYYRIAYSYVHNETDAGDIVQEGAYQAIRHCASLQKPEYVKTWIYRIMLNEVFLFCRNRKKETPCAEELSQRSQLDTYCDIDLLNALDQLDARDKSVIILRYFEEYKLDEIADILEENISTVKSRLYRSLKKLRLQLVDDWIWEG